MEPLSLSSNTESWSCNGAASSDQWSLHIGVDSSWSSCIETCQLSSFSSAADQQFTHQFQSLPNIITSDNYNVHYDPVESAGLSLGSYIIGCNAEHLSLASNQSLACAAGDMAWYRGTSATQWNQLPASASPTVEHIAPIPAFVSSANYEGMFLCS